MAEYKRQLDDYTKMEEARKKELQDLQTKLSQTGGQSKEVIDLQEKLKNLDIQFSEERKTWEQKKKDDEARFEEEIKKIEDGRTKEVQDIQAKLKQAGSFGKEADELREKLKNLEFQASEDKKTWESQQKVEAMKRDEDLRLRLEDQKKKYDIAQENLAKAASKESEEKNAAHLRQLEEQKKTLEIAFTRERETLENQYKKLYKEEITKTGLSDSNYRQLEDQANKLKGQLQTELDEANKD